MNHITKALAGTRGIRNAKAQIEILLVRDTKGNEIAFYKCVRSRRKTKRSIGPLLNGKVTLIIKM